MPRIIHFDIAVDDPARAEKFYGSVFGWHFQKWPGPMDYWLVSTGKDDEPGIDGGMAKRRKSPVDGANTIGVASVDESLKQITAAGGAIIEGKMPIPGVGWLAYCKDTEGNAFGIMQADPSASLSDGG